MNNEQNEITLLKEKKTDIYWVDPRCIIVDESFNVRDDYGDIESLKNSIAEGWVDTSILLAFRAPQAGYFMLTDGHRRNRAIQELLAENRLDAEFRVPMRLHKQGYRIEDRLFDVYQTQDNKPLTDKEICELFYRLKHKFNKSNTEIAKRIGKSIAYVTQMLSIAESPNEIKDKVYDGSLLKSAALAVMDKSKKQVKKETGKVNNDLSNEIAVKTITEAIERGKNEGVTVQSRKTMKLKSDAPKGNIALIEELVEIGKGQHCDIDTVEIVELLLEYLNGRQMNPLEFYGRAAEVKALPVLK
jgi:ParB/RepB/Spo0J family partition protein